jgi:hypothetical protein
MGWTSECLFTAAFNTPLFCFISRSPCRRELSNENARGLYDPAKQCWTPCQASKLCDRGDPWQARRIGTELLFCCSCACPAGMRPGTPLKVQPGIRAPFLCASRDPGCRRCSLTLRHPLPPSAARSTGSAADAGVIFSQAVQQRTDQVSNNRRRLRSVFSFMRISRS